MLQLRSSKTFLIALTIMFLLDVGAVARAGQPVIWELTGRA